MKSRRRSELILQNFFEKNKTFKDAPLYLLIDRRPSDRLRGRCLRLAKKVLSESEGLDSTSIEWGNSKVVDKKTRKGLAFLRGGRITFSGELENCSQAVIEYKNLLTAG